jgi:hypothetical protein
MNRSGLLLLLTLIGSQLMAQQPTTLRMAFQPVYPLNEKFALGSYLNLNYTPANDLGNFTAALPVAQYQANKQISITGYVMNSFDFPKGAATKIEIRPVAGVRYDVQAGQRVRLATWLRMEARFRDITGNSSYYTRGRLRGYFDYAFGKKPRQPGSLFMQADIEPQYNFEKGYFSGLLSRLALAYNLDRGSYIELRYFFDVTSFTPEQPLQHSGNQIRISLIKTYGLKRLMAGELQRAEIDE